MSKVYMCDRCGSIGEINAEGDKRFSLLDYGFVGGLSKPAVHLCPHCTKKLEEFLSDPNCMETVEEESEEGR